jgi:putative flavoprotein involved in K+ transport
VEDCIVIGGGQAGLATSYHLRRLGVDHRVLERGAVANTWRTARWDGFHLNTPNWATQLPGAEPPGPDPDAFPPLAEVIAFMDGYADRIGAPVETGVKATALRRSAGAFALDVEGETVAARSVVVATGAFQQPTIPPAVEGLPAGVQVLHTSDYRRPADVSPDGVLIVGTGQSGCEIAQELLDAGRTVHLAVGRCPWAPRRHRGRELVRWLVDTGMADDTPAVLPVPAARVAGNVTVSGVRGGVDVNPLILEAAGAHLHGRLTGFRDGAACFAGDLEASLEFGLGFERDLRARFDDHAAATGLDLPEHEPVELPNPRRDEAAELPLGPAGIDTVLLANGYRPAFGWIDLPLFDELGFPRTDRGMSEAPGLAFVGLPWMVTRRSPLLLGVGRDAGHVAGAVAEYLEG